MDSGLVFKDRNGFLGTYGIDSEAANVDEDVIGEQRGTRDRVKIELLLITGGLERKGFHRHGFYEGLFERFRVFARERGMWLPGK